MDLNYFLLLDLDTTPLCQRSVRVTPPKGAKRDVPVLPAAQDAYVKSRNQSDGFQGIGIPVGDRIAVPSMLVSRLQEAISQHNNGFAQERRTAILEQLEEHREAFISHLGRFGIEPETEVYQAAIQKFPTEEDFAGAFNISVADARPSVMFCPELTGEPAELIEARKAAWLERMEDLAIRLIEASYADLVLAIRAADQIAIARNPAQSIVDVMTARVQKAVEGITLRHDCIKACQGEIESDIGATEFQAMITLVALCESVLQADSLDAARARAELQDKLHDAVQGFQQIDCKAWSDLEGLAKTIDYEEAIAECLKELEGAAQDPDGQGAVVELTNRLKRLKRGQCDAAALASKLQAAEAAETEPADGETDPERVEVEGAEATEVEPEAVEVDAVEPETIDVEVAGLEVEAETDSVRSDGSSPGDAEDGEQLNDNEVELGGTDELLGDHADEDALPV